MLTHALKNCWKLFFQNILNQCSFLFFCILLLLFFSALFIFLFSTLIEGSVSTQSTRLNLSVFYVVTYCAIVFASIGFYNAALHLHKGKKLVFSCFVPAKKYVKGFVTYTAFALAVASIPLLFSVLILFISHAYGDGVGWVRMLIGFLNVSQIFIAVLVWWRYSFALPAFLDKPVEVSEAFEKSLHITRSLDTQVVTARAITLVLCFLVSITLIGLVVTLPMFFLTEVWFYNKAKGEGAV